MLPVVLQLSRRVRQKAVESSGVLLCVVGTTFYIYCALSSVQSMYVHLQVTDRVYESTELKSSPIVRLPS